MDTRVQEPQNSFALTGGGGQGILMAVTETGHWMGSVASVMMAIGLAAFLAGCVTVRPEARAVLADPKMRFRGDPRAAAQLEHVLQNREGASGGGSVQGGGCGCN
jgi:hypothetical protein